MKVLLTGATGFVGGVIARQLLHAGHTLVAPVRNRAARRPLSGVEFVDGDFSVHHKASDFSSQMVGVDAVINAVGIIRETRNATFQALHADAPIALFQAALDAKVRRLVQVSALGVRADSRYSYQSSKAQADSFLVEAAREQSCILRPSLIFGESGEATKMFRNLASLPVIPLVGTGEYCFRPVQVEDIARLCLAAIERPAMPTGIFEIGGAEALTLRELLLALRAHQRGVVDPSDSLWTEGPTLPVPLFAMKMLAKVGDLVSIGPMDSDMLGMLSESENFQPADAMAHFGVSPVGLREHLRSLSSFEKRCD
jgi:uncharacterized protein YbjT (DUF2867 family)